MGGALRASAHRPGILDASAMPVFALILAQLAVASAALLARIGLANGMTAMALTAWRLALASLVVVPAAQIRRGEPGTSPLALPGKLRLVGAGLALAGHFWAWLASLEHVSVARSTLLVSTTPIWAAVGVWAWRRRPPGRRFWLGLTLAMAGGWMVTGGPEAGASVLPGGNAVLGDGLALLGAALIAFYFLMTADLQTTVGTGRVVGWTYGSAALAMLATLLVTPHERPPVPMNAAAWGAVLGMAAAPQLVGHTLMNWSLKHFSAHVVAAATLLEPVFAAALAWIFLHEQLRAFQIAGAAVLLAGIAIVLAKAEGARGPAAGAA